MRVFEIFLSIQGEGKGQGYPCSFVRFAGCNLNCSWCDTPEARGNGIEMSKESIFRELMSLNCFRVCITGGEPLIQEEELSPLLKLLKENNFKIEIETNGTMDFRPFQEYASICMDVKCPSSGEKSDLSLLNQISENDTVKFVVEDNPDLKYAGEILKNHQISGEVFFSPVEGSDVLNIAEYIISNSLDARVQLQIHKFIGVK